eukprot:GHVQ01024330.1.p1 GENE.GHVQ01024330.1~~GHVQ01024330.1.p1  ORF type:complete len:168 (+),score=13.99 GHVQ01024330.1:144-647(+)
MFRSAIRLAGAHKLPELPYSLEALQPYISAETLQYHHGKHHAAYVNKLNQLVGEKSSLAGRSLEDIIKTEDGIVFNQAAQIWNHTFYWNSMKPGGGGEPTGVLRDKIITDFSSIENFKEKFSLLAAGHFGSGWTWLVLGKDNKLNVVGGHDAMNPLRDGSGVPLLTW